MRIPRLGIIVFGLLAVTAGVAAEIGASTRGVTLRLKHGDDPHWAAPDWDDRDWEPISIYGLPPNAGICWLRFQVVRPSEPTKRSAWLNFYNFEWPSDELGAPIDSVTFNGLFSFDFYWDGRLLERSGVPGNTRAAEVPGPLDHLFRIPVDLRGPGEHVVALRFSNHHYNLRGIAPSLGFRLDNYRDRLIYETRRPFLPLIGVGVSLFVAVVCLILTRFLPRRRTLLLCGALGLSLSLFYALVAMRWIYNTAPYDTHGPRLTLATIVMAGIGLLLPWVLAEHFTLSHRLRWGVLLVPFLVVSCCTSPVYDVKAFWVTRTMLVAALAIAGWAVRRHKPGAWPVLAAAVTGLVMLTDGDGRSMLDTTFFLMVSAVLLFVIVAIGWQFRLERRRAQEAVLTAARLETELLKKNLQPHFLLNTLTAVSELIEQDPAGAVKFIEDLAAEFRSLALMSGERLVPMQRELDLCRAHLKVISRRTGREIGLVADGVADDALVPPALFLTLIENGMVHQKAGEGATYRLRAQSGEGDVRYVFLSPGRTREMPGRPAGGTGLRYVKARLEESFPGHWEFSQSAVADGWQTVVGWQVAPKLEGGG